MIFSVGFYLRENVLRQLAVTVRREKALDFSGCNSRPGTGSLHPVAIEAAVAVTKLSELSMERSLGDPASVQAIT
jgi:hypothetical protein